MFKILLNWLIFTDNICNQDSYTNLYSQNNKINNKTDNQIEKNENDDFVFDVEDLVHDLYTEIIESSEILNEKLESASITTPKYQINNTPMYITDYILFNSS